MTNSLKKEIEELIKNLDLNCFVEEFKEKVDWNGLCRCQILSENFIREFRHKVD